MKSDLNTNLNIRVAFMTEMLAEIEANETDDSKRLRRLRHLEDLMRSGTDGMSVPSPRYTAKWTG